MLHHFIWVATVSLCVLGNPVSVTKKDEIWRCSGPTTSISYLKCNQLGLKGVSQGSCYYLEHFAQYRPCSSICDSIGPSTISEARCLALCPGYLTSNCRLASKEGTTPSAASTTSPTNTPSPASSTRAASDSKKGSIQPSSIAKDNSTIYMIVGVLGGIAVIAAVVVPLVVRRQCRNKDPEPTKPADNEKLLNNTTKDITPVQPAYQADNAGANNCRVNTEGDNGIVKNSDEYRYIRDAVDPDVDPLYRDMEATTRTEEEVKETDKEGESPANQDH